jgi:PAS domain S-box-containing protein
MDAPEPPAVQTSERAEVALRASEEKYRLLVSQVRDYAIFAMDVEGRPVSWNEGVGAVLGYGRDEFIGSSIELLFLPPDIEAGLPHRELQVAREQGASNDDRWLRRRNGSAFFAAGKTMRLADSQGRCIGFTKVLRDDTQRVLNEGRLRASEERFRALVENVRDYAIFMLDDRGTVTEWTQGAERVTGYSADDALGRHLALLYTPEQRLAGEPERDLQLAAREGRAEHEAWRSRKSGERFWVNEVTTALRDAGGKLLGFTQISRDLTDRKRAEEAAREEDQRKREEARRKDEFLATLAHELRNPLAPLRNGLQIARLTIRADSLLQDTVRMMERQLNHLVRLVDDLLDVARINSGKLDLKRRRVLLSEVLANSAEDVRSLMDARNQRLAVERDSEELAVMGDFDRLAQVFVNLLSNAAKYSEPGACIRLHLSREHDEAVARIIDHGIGIPREDLPHVFDLFSQVRVHQGRAQGGLGIGLSLVKNLVLMHGGTVSVDSAGSGMGSTFSVRLPLLPSATTGERHGSAADAAPRSARHHRILVVDDNEDAADSLAVLIRLLGHDVQLAHDGVEAMDQARAFHPDIVFLDLGMPRMDGIEAARRLRSSPGGEQLRLVALTGWGQATDRERTRAAGFDAHLVKPIDTTVLAQVLSAQLPASARPQRPTWN